MDTARGSTAGFGGTGVCVGVRFVSLPSGRARGFNGDRKTNNFGKLDRQKVGLFSKVGSARAVRAAGGAPVVVVRLPPSKMRAESKGVRAGSEAMHSDTRARKQAT
jgi:hypothetical protein